MISSKEMSIQEYQDRLCKLKDALSSSYDLINFLNIHHPEGS